MIQIAHDNLNFFAKDSNEIKIALNKIRKFNFIKTKAAYLLMDSSIIDKSHIAISDTSPYPYLFIRFLDKETLRDTRMNK